MAERALGTFRIDREQWEAFQDKARENGFTASSLIISWIEGYLDGKLDSIDEQENSLDASIDAIEQRIDIRIDTMLAPLQNRLDRLEQELGKFAA